MTSSDPVFVRAAELLGRPADDRLDPAPQHGRSRVDLMWHDGRLGRRGPTPADGGGWTFQPPDAASITGLEPAVADLLPVFEASAPPPGNMQVRFRVAPDGRTGLWLDLSRAGIAALIEESTWLRGRLAAGWVIEMGQRGEAGEEGPEGLRLVSATPHAWLPAWSPDDRAIPLTCLVASFTQPGPLINRALVEAAGRLLSAAGVVTASWCEWGAGYGNLTAWLHARLGPAGIAVESDGRSVGLLIANRDRHFPGVRIERGAAGATDAATDAGSPPARTADVWILDPPRPGFPALTRTLATRPDRPRVVLALHCDVIGLEADTRELRAAGYTPTGWIGVEAFPGTRFLEVVSVWGAGNQL